MSVVKKKIQKLEKEFEESLKEILEPYSDSLRKAAERELCANENLYNRTANPTNILGGLK